jgi:hypothetical protein
MNDSAPPFSAEPDAEFAERLELELLDRLLAAPAASVADSDATSRVSASVPDERDHKRIVDSAGSDRPRWSRRRRQIAAGTAGALAAAAFVAVLALWADGDDPRSVFAGHGGGSGQPSTPAAGPVLPLGHVFELAAGLGLPASDEASVSRVTVGGPGLVAVGSVRAPKGRDAAVWISADGTTWSRVPDDEAVFGGRGIQEMNDVTPGGPGLVAVGRDSSIVGSDTYALAAVWTSVDGITWSRVANDDGVFGRATGKPNDVFGMSAVTAGGPGLVAVGGRGGESDEVVRSGQYIFHRSVGAVWTSADGTTWTRVPHDRAAFGEWHARTHDGLSASMTDVTVGGPGLVAVGTVYRGERGFGHGAVWTSPDGVHWTLADDEIEAVVLTAVAAGGPGLVAVGLAVETPTPPTAGPMPPVVAAVWTSTDGTTWTSVPPQPEVLDRQDYQALNIVAVDGVGLVAVGVSEAWTSADGITWSRASEDPELWAGNTIETVLRLYGFPGRGS